MAAQSSIRPRRATCTVAVAVLVAIAASLSADTPSASAAAARYYTHGSLWCDGTLISVGRGMTATVPRREAVRMRHTLHNWDGQSWAKIDAPSPVQTLRKRYARTVSAEYSYWFPIFDTVHDPPQFPSWSISVQGDYAIRESIRWLNRRGEVVAQHKDWLGHTFCSF
jgi:hypothetical protein